MKNKFAFSPSIPILILALVSAFAACGPAGEEEERTIRVVVQPAASGTISTESYASARLEGAEEALIYPSMPGRVEEVLVSEGDFVEAGQRLIKMDTDQQAGAGSSAALAGLSAARANQENARANFERLEALYEAGAVSAQDLDAVRTGLEAATAQLSQAQAGYTQARTARDNAWIAAPFSGRIGRIWARAGNSSSGASPLISISGNGGVLARILLPERDIYSLEVGQAAYVTVGALDNMSIPGVVTAVSPSVDPISGLVSVEVRFDDTEGVLRPGLSGRVAVITRTSDDAVVYPERVLRRTRSGFQIAVVQDGRAELREVTIGIRSHGMVEIVSGIVPGDSVIIVGQNSVIDGSPVEVVEQ